MGIQVVYVPIGVGTYHMETAEDLFNRSVNTLKKISEEVVTPEKVLLTVDEVAKYLDGKNPDLVILQNITFANAAYASEVLRRFKCPIVLWTLREPVIDGGRLRSNSLTGAYSAANTIAAFRGAGNFEFMFGSPEEDHVVTELKAAIDACSVLVSLKSLKLSAIGHTPQGFGFGRALDAEILQKFGVTLEAIEARELIDKAKAYTDEECQADLEEAKSKVVGLEAMPEKNVKDFARLYKAYKTYITEGGIGAVSSRCWPDFFVSFGTPVCMVLSLLNSMDVPASCEADVYGALSMFVGSKFTGHSTFFGDPVAMDEKEGTITYWHCGMASCDLARCDTGAQVGVHPNRKIGPVMDFGCEACKDATIFRIGRKPDGTFRFMIAEGEVLDKPKQFNGTSIVVKTDYPADKVVEDTIKNGWEPHYVVIYKRIGNELEKLAHMLDIEIVKY
ncbi:L-fucose isomerase [Pseudobutyrivibrio sp. YE44]|uniref:fucose isomerase n=1 Tax=Pseudobutyrivibrio sp. YE44 TaxID=1520802 RepID=UPI00088F75C7|nr:fucose isomerase [Pseudobutyrivibrio sp. YE44]SDB53430.1 L-fucose isomerase [Pseudobutyrivibrio sp. YE44]